MYVASNGIKCLVILPEPDPPNPRDTDYQDNLGSMVCWHGRYRLGDPHAFRDSNEFAATLALNVTDNDLFSFILNGKCTALRAIQSADRADEYVLLGCWDLSNKDNCWEDLGLRFKCDSPNMTITHGDMPRSDILDYMNTGELINLITESNTAVLKPLHLYDHSGLSMSTSSFIGRASHAEWDSGCVGFIYMEKETALKELAVAADTLTICKLLAKGARTPVFLSKCEGKTAEEVFSSNGFSPVQRKDVNNLFDPALSPENKPLIHEELFLKQRVFKKENVLYCYPGDEFDASYQLSPIAIYNPDLQRVTEETWKARADEILEGEVREYDSFLRGDVYGYMQYEGLDEIDSCWGFNPGGEDIRGMIEDMVGDWAIDLKEKMLHASYEPTDRFDINAFYESHDFPGLRGKIHKSVVEYLQQQGSSSPNPYGAPINDLLSDRDGLLTSITEALYDQHLIPTTAAIQETIQDYAGISRERKPKLTRDDLEPARDYTEDELLAILKSKPALDTLIAGAQNRQCSTSPGTMLVSHDNEL